MYSFRIFQEVDLETGNSCFWKKGYGMKDINGKTFLCILLGFVGFFVPLGFFLCIYSQYQF